MWCVFQCSIQDLADGIRGNIDYTYLFIDLWIKFVEVYGKHSSECYHLEHLHERVIETTTGNGGFPFPTIETLNGENGESEFQKWASKIVISQSEPKRIQFAFRLQHFLEIFDINTFNLHSF